MIVCHCEVVSDRQIRKAIGNGAACPGAIGLATGAGTQCGNCVPSIVALLAQYAGTAPTDREDSYEAPQCSCCRAA
ncbi:(2Fe-2S)-binding protein [Ammonicoccus fulvus]|uniref:(2Fe-2S)-binding protein n=1 Tax=Ammonicoccus fulvus TaxID=3138240 RepID=UPI003CC7D4C3